VVSGVGRRAFRRAEQDNLVIDWAFDPDGDMRMLDGNGDGEPVVDVGADEFLSK